MSNYNIIDGYNHRTKYNHFDDMPNEDGWQKEVYLLAKSIMHKYGLEKIADVGCGSGYKLINYFPVGFETVGYEIEPTFSKLKEKYPDRVWRESDFDSTPEEADLVICSDVIEHVIDPDKLCEYLKKFNAQYYVISTPERDMVYGGTHYGPPANPTHVREWNSQEFKDYMESQFYVISHQITNRAQWTQAVITQLK